MPPQIPRRYQPQLFVFVPVAQGTAADIMKKAMVLVARRLDAWRASLEDGLDCPRLLMQVSCEWRI